MNRLKFYKYAAIGLLLLNIAIVAFFFFTKPRFPHHRLGMQKGAGEIMHLDKDQNEAFLELAQQHMLLMEGINKEQRNLLKPYFQQLIDSTFMIDSVTFLREFQDFEVQKIASTYQHFQDVKSLLKTDQQGYFEEFMNGVLSRILLEENQKPFPRKK